jgi:hypothetical protein
MDNISIGCVVDCTSISNFKIYPRFNNKKKNICIHSFTVSLTGTEEFILLALVVAEVSIVGDGLISIIFRSN